MFFQLPFPCSSFQYFSSLWPHLVLRGEINPSQHHVKLSFLTGSGADPTQTVLAGASTPGLVQKSGSGRLWVGGWLAVRLCLSLPGSLTVWVCLSGCLAVCLAVWLCLAGWPGRAPAASGLTDA